MFSLIQQYPYLTLLITTIIEWPIATFISAGLAAHHILHIEYVIIITVIGDVLGDCILYLIGRYVHHWWYIDRLIQKLPHKERLDQSFNNKSWTYMIIGKFTPYLATPTLIFAGIQHMNIIRFISYSCIISIWVKATYIALWYIGAVSIQQVQWFLHWRASIVSYIIIWCLCFRGAGTCYHHLWTYITQSSSSKHNKVK